MLLAVRISSYGCTWEVWRALKKLELLSAAPALLSCSPNFPRASITRYTHAKHEPILKYKLVLERSGKTSVYTRKSSRSMLSTFIYMYASILNISSKNKEIIVYNILLLITWNTNL